MMPPIVSVIMPVYHTEEYLKEAVDSILNQTFKDLELIILCDADQPEVLKILKSFNDYRMRIHIMIMYHNVSEKMNLACNYVRGKYVARMDSDDISLPDRIEKQVAFLNKYSNVGIIGGQIEYINPDGTHRNQIHLPKSYAGILWAMAHYNPIANPTFMMRAELFRKFRYNTEIVTGVEDYDYWVHAANVTKICNLPDCVLKYRIKDISGFIGNAFYTRDEQRRTDEELIRQKAKGIFWRNLKWILFPG
jgi:glycosyltransferase involved in cell wall biosynthesis